tara:strand:+ start:997 stop:2688 length:1692 start_codon:yes stop_codon:yes gene_type:complete
MEPLMLRAVDAARKLRRLPVSNHPKHIERISKLVSEETNSEINDVIKAVGGGKMSEAVFETWVYIVSRLSGKKTKPTSADIDKILEESEIVPEGKKWITSFRKKTKNDEFLLKAIELIGADIKKISNIPWGSKLGIVHKSVDDFYKLIPDNYKEAGSKANTADMVFVTKGTVAGLLKALPNSTMSWTEEGKISIEGSNIEFVQVSLKKGQENARIGKLNTLINAVYGQQAMRPTQLVSEEIELIQELYLLKEGFFTDLLKTAKGKLSAVLDWAKGFLVKLRNSILKVGIKALKSIQRDKAHQAASKLLKETGFTISEAAGDDVEINKPMLREMKTLKNEIIKNDLANKEYQKILQNVKKINSLKSGAVIMQNSGTNPLLEMNDFKRAADIVLSRGLGSHITREELSPALKLCVNYASYKTFNTILEDMQNKIPLYKKAGDALVGLSAKLKAEAMFGNTLLPLWIVYGMGGGAHYKHTRNEFEDKTGAEIAELGESMDVPYLVIQIGRSGGKQNYNAIYLLILSGSIKKGDEILPEYVKIQFINRSGSGFSYKIDAMSTQVGYK